MALAPFGYQINCAPSELAYWQGQSVFSGTTIGAAPDDNQIQRSEVQLVFDRTTPALINDDVAVCSLAFVQETLSFGTSIINSGQKATIEGLLDTFWTSDKVNHSAHWSLREYRWHDYVTSWTKPGPATRVTAKGVAATGSSGTTVPDQNAESVTYKTASRIHWGRTYLPSFVYTNYTSTGRLTTTAVDAVAAAMRTVIIGANTATTPMVVPSTSHRAVMSIAVIQMDDTPDVIRSRRAKRPSYRKIYTS